MSKTVEFWFDFSSPYGYVASLWMDEFAAETGATVVWRPFLIGIVFKHSGSQPMLNFPLKGDYARRDMVRAARRLGKDLKLPETFPFSSVAASRAVYALEGDPAASQAVAKALYTAAYEQGQDISDPANVAAIATAAGHDVAERLAAPEVKQRLKTVTDEAVERGIFGSPFFIADGEPFWGNEKRDDMRAWLENGGW